MRGLCSTPHIAWLFCLVWPLPILLSDSGGHTMCIMHQSASAGPVQVTGIHYPAPPPARRGKVPWVVTLSDESRVIAYWHWPHQLFPALNVEHITNLIASRITELKLKLNSRDQQYTTSVGIPRDLSLLVSLNFYVNIPWNFTRQGPKKDSFWTQ